MVSQLEEIGVDVYTRERDAETSLVTEDESGTLRTGRVETGWVVEGRVRFRLDGSADCYFIHCAQENQIFVLHNEEAESSTSMRLESNGNHAADSACASAHSLENNWPPSITPQRTEESVPAVSLTISKIKDSMGQVEIRRNKTHSRMLDVSINNISITVSAERGWIENGKLRFNANGDGVDFYSVLDPKEEELYLVSDAEFDQSISLRVEPPAKPDPTINYADKYRFEERWPPDKCP